MYIESCKVSRYVQCPMRLLALLDTRMDTFRTSRSAVWNGIGTETVEMGGIDVETQVFTGVC